MMQDHFPDLASDSDHVHTPPECQEESSSDSSDFAYIDDMHPTGSGELNMEWIASHHSWPPKDLDIAFPEVTISAFTETGKAELSIQVPLQRSYTGRLPVIPSSLADTPCATLGIQGVLDNLNTILITTYTLDTPSLPSILGDFIEKNYDFGTTYGRLRHIWYADDWSNIRDKLHKLEEGDREMRREALLHNRIVNVFLQPRRIWDLYSNRVMPWWVIDVDDTSWSWLQPISHAWVDEKDREDVWTPINRNEWPVPVPKDASLDLIRIEMLNLGLQYTWLDVLCLRQKGGPEEDLRVKEWKLDVPTIGRVYAWSNIVVIYLSGLGRPFSLKEGDLDSDRCWFRRAWTLQEVGKGRIIAGNMSDGLLTAYPIDEDGNYETELLTGICKWLKLKTCTLFSSLADMQKRVSINPVDKVAGLAFPLRSETIPAYHESESLEDAWTALTNSMSTSVRAFFLVLYPGVGLGCKKWRPTWGQVVTETLPADRYFEEYVSYDSETDEDCFEGFCIERGRVCGLDVQLDEGAHRCGRLVVQGMDGMQHTFAIRVTHQIPIPEDMYTLLGSAPWFIDDCHWAIGLRLPDHRFEKVSVAVMDCKEHMERLQGLGIITLSRYILL